MTFRVQKRPCSTCIYRKDSPLDIRKLEADAADKHGGFKGHGSATIPRMSAAAASGIVTSTTSPLASSRSGLNAVEFVTVDTLGPICT